GRRRPAGRALLGVRLSQRQATAGQRGKLHEFRATRKQGDCAELSGEVSRPPSPFSSGITPASLALACTETCHAGFPRKGTGGWLVVPAPGDVITAAGREIDELGVFTEEGQRHRARRAVTELADDGLGHALVVRFVLVVVLVAVHH